jgi:ankyrin repeat protein
VEQGADVSVRNIVGETPLILAAGYGNLETVKLLLSKGADVNAADQPTHDEHGHKRANAARHADHASPLHPGHERLDSR